MPQAVIRDFLNLPGIAGFTLIDKRSRPCFCRIEQALNYQQKAALDQGILQVVETLPKELESFKFQFRDLHENKIPVNPDCSTM